MKHLITLTAMAAFSTLAAQPVVTNAEDFTIGTVLKFINCSTTSVTAGAAGPNQTWNFSGLVALGDTITSRMVLPSTTSNGALFPNANMVEKYSDGRFVYVNKTTTESYLVGFADTTASYPPSSYPNSMLFAKRPMYYNAVYTDNYTIYGSPAIGTITIVPDAYGTLILPNGTYTNVLREKVMMAHPYYSATSYFWFDGNNPSALLKITEGDDVEYLSKQSLPTAIKKTEHQDAPLFYPNPAQTSLYFDNTLEGHVAIMDMTGKVVKEEDIFVTHNSMNIETLPAGIYMLRYSNNSILLHEKLIIR